MNKLFCFFGLHKWQHNISRYSSRKCYRCAIVQQLVREKTASFSITGAGVISVSSSDIIQSVEGQRQLDALRKAIEAGILSS